MCGDFGSMSGAVQLSGPTAKHNGALLTFLGMDIPQPASPRKIRTTLTQNQDRPQEVGAINYTMSNGKWGAIVYALGGPEALVKELGKRKKPASRSPWKARRSSAPSTRKAARPVNS
jgi:hypothetical protein